MESTSFRPYDCDLRLNHLSDFHRIPYRNIYKKLFSNGNVSANRLIECCTSVKDEFTRTSRIILGNKFCVANLKVLSFSIPCFWVPVTTAWRVLRLRMEERPPIWRVVANKLNKQSQTADKGWSSSFGVGRGANNSSP